jgi:GMP synthase (glutamine-hydrolysing)
MGNGEGAEVLVLQHAQCEEPGRIGDAIALAGLRSRVIHAAHGEPVPRTIGSAAGLVVMGGPMSAYDRDRHPHLTEELWLIESALEARVPVLGICLGSQLLAHALGAPVQPGRRKEIGWFPIRWMGKALDDRVLAPVSATRPTVFHWHGDVFDLPAGAVPLARSALTDVQAFRFGATAYGFLCHLEVTPSLVAGMARTFRDELVAERIDGDALVADAERYDASLGHLARRVFGHWVGFVSGRASIAGATTAG